MQDKYIILILFLSIFCFLYMLFKDWKGPFKKLVKQIKIVGSVTEIEKSLEEKVFNVDINARTKSKLNYITGKKISFSDKTKSKLNTVILNRSHTWGYLSFVIMTIIGLWIGFGVGNILNNFVISVILGVVGATLPYMYLTIKIKVVDRDKDKKLLMVMGNIVATYMVKDSFIDSVQEVLPNIPEPLYKHFKLFIDDILYFGNDRLQESSERLANGVNNFYFYEFMQLAVQAEYGNTGLKYTMKSVPLDYQRYLEKNERYSRIISDYNVEFILRILLLPLILGFIKIISDDYYFILTNHPFGKLVLAGVMLLYVIATLIFRKYNKDIKLEL